MMKYRLLLPEIRIDAYKFSTQMRRPISQRVRYRQYRGSGTDSTEGQVQTVQWARNKLTPQTI